MSPQGSNELNLLLQTKVVKIKVELDVKGSKLAGQVNKITKFLEDKRVKLKVELLTTGLHAEVQKINKFLVDKKVKLGVELKYNKNDINSQIKAINTLLKSGDGLSDIKVDLNIDIKGSASKIKDQLKEVNKEISEFNRNYKKMIDETNKSSESIGSNIKKNSSPVGAKAETYAKSLLDAKRYMSEQYGDGLFTSTEMKDANGALLGFMANLTKANGVVQKIRYDWNEESGSFTPINRQTVTTTEKNVASALKSLRQLDSEIAKLGKDQDKYWQESLQLKKLAENGALTQDTVDSLKQRIKDEQALQNQIKTENALLRQQKELIAEINRAQKNTKSGKYKNDLGTLKNSVSMVDLDDVMAKNQLNELRSSFTSIKQGYNDSISKEKELKNATEKRKDVLAEIARLEKSKNFTSSGATSRQYIEETKALAKNIKTMEEYSKVKERMNATNRGFKSIKLDEDIENQLTKLRTAMYDYAQTTGRSLSVIETRYQQVAFAIKNNLASATSEVKKFNRLTENFKVEQAYKQRRDSIVKNANHQEVARIVEDKDNAKLKEYITNLNGANVAMMKLSTDAKGISRITAQFESTKKTAKQVVYEIDKVDGKLRQISTAEVFNANRNLGIFEQLKIAMARVPVWTIAMTSFYGSLRTVQNMTNEILELDRAMTELRRVSGANIDTDFLFEGSLQMAKELGNNVHDILNAVSDLSRTFGDFNERQLLAIANTATLMSNVSDLSADEATKSLVGTMNAFNITAEDSIRIVDSMNEVDNNYAISTQQLAQGLAKSASTSKTFGVTLEENLGHITAIGAVTMESGNIIGNSLKTIYSRITTMTDVEDIFTSIGMSIRNSEGEMKDVADILEELSYKWNDLSAEERQNIGVKVAGRYQLSRFLALMNNYSMATEATNTALNSQGSATRENAEYLKSYEARINALKNSFTELSSSIGDAFLGGGLSVGIDLLTKLASITIGVVDNFGVLPIVLGAVGGILMKFGVLGKSVSGVDGALRKLHASQVGVTGAFAKMGAVGRTALVGVGTAVDVANAKISKTTASLWTAKKAWVSFASSTIVLAGFVALGIVIEKLVSHFNKLREEAKEAEKVNQTLVESYRASGDGMQSLISQYEKLANKKTLNGRLTEQETAELEKLNNELASKLPTVVDYYDANGNAILKNTNYIKEQIEYVARLSKEQAKLKDLKMAENIREQAINYEHASEKVQKLKEEIEELENKHGKKQYIGAGDYITADNTKEIQENTVKMMQLESARREQMSATTKLIQEQAVAYLEANGKMVGFGDNQQKLIENFVTYNDKILITASNNNKLEETMLDMTERSKELSSVFTSAYDKMSKGMNTNELENLRNHLEAVSASVPESLLVIDDAKSVEGMKKLTDGMKEIINVSQHVKDGSSDIEYLTDRLEKAGLAPEEAKRQLARLANEFSNTAIRAGLASESVEDVTDSIEDLSQEAIKAIDPLEGLFGYSSGDMSAIKSHIELMELLYLTMGDNAEANEKFKSSQTAIADALNVSDQWVLDNIHNLNIISEEFGNLKTVMDEHGNTILDFSDMSVKGAQFFKEFVDAGGQLDLVTKQAKETSENVLQIVDAYDFANSKMKEPFALNESLDTTAIEKYNTPLQNFLQDSLKAQDALSDNANKLNSTMSDLEKSSASLEVFGESISTVGENVDTTKEKTKEFAKDSQSSLGDLEVTAKTRVKTVVDRIAEIGRKALEIVSNIRSMNSELSNASSAISNYNTRASTIRNVSTSNSNYGMISQGLGASYNGVSESIAESMATFSATAESVATSGGLGGEGTSGVIKQTTPSFIALHGSSTKYIMPTSSSSGSSSKKSSSTSKAKSTKDKAEELAELYVIDLLERKRTKYQGTLNALEARVSGMAKNTNQYRYVLTEVMKYEQMIHETNIQSLASLEKKNISLEKQLSLLSDTSKHTKKQRDEYNKLQQEYDSNLSEIASLKGEIESTIVELRKKTEEIFLDFVEQIVSNIDKGLEAIAERIDDLDFELEVLDLTDPDNTLAKVDLLSDKVRELYKEQKDYNDAQAELKKEIASATAKYGAQSDSVKTLVKQMKDYKEAWEETTLEILRAEKEIRDLRGEIADEIIEASKKQFETAKKNAEKTKDIEIENAKKAHEAKMKFYDKESERISELYDQRIKALDDEYNQEEYEEDVADKNKEIAKLQERAKSYSGDTSLEGRKIYAEINEEIEKKQKELDKFVKKNRLDALKEQLNAEKDMILDRLNTQKEADEEAHEVFVKQLEAERDAISEHYEEITDDEKKWAKVREELMKGNFKVVKDLLSDMGIDLEQLADGTFNTLSEGFSNYSQEVRDFVTEINSMINQINSMTNSAYGKTSNISATQTVATGSPTSSSAVGSIIKKAYSGEALSNASFDDDYLYRMIKNSNIPQDRMQEIWRKAQNGISLSEPSPEQSLFYDYFLEILKNGKLKKFDTGGYTGDNVPKSGGLAILDNKELVLNQTQTSHILDAVKLLEKVKFILPSISKSSMESKFATASSFINNNNYNLNVNIASVTGDKQGGETVVKEIMKGLKKLGRQ